MRPPDGLSEEEQFAPIEALLRGAAEFEPDEPAPGLLTSGGVALLLAQDAARRRRTLRARVAVFAGALTGAAACSASLVLALNQPVRQTQTQAPRPAPVQVAQQVPVVEATEAVVAVAPPVVPKKRVASRAFAHRSRRLRHPRAARPVEPQPPVWTEETVERQVTGVLAQGWLVQAREDGSIEVTPTLVDVPLTSDPATCDPALSPAPAASEATKLEENEAR